MNLDLHTLVILQSMTFSVQAFVLYIQYRVNCSFSGTGWWVSGVSFMALAGALMPFLEYEPLRWVAIFANPMMILGQLFLYVGMLRFFGKRAKPSTIAWPYFFSVLAYLFFIFIDQSLSARTILVNFALATASFLTASVLLDRRNTPKSGITAVVGAAFLTYAVFLVVRATLAIVLPPMQTYTDQGLSIILAFIVPTITSMIWTYGFIIMINQRLNMENLLEKEKMQHVFNTGPDAAFISRLSDGSMIDVNNSFSDMTGYPREEAVGTTTLEIRLWRDPSERGLLLAALEQLGFCENMEFEFVRKDGSRFHGAVSARKLVIYGIPHIVCLIRDITERKQAEEQIKLLIQQLEAERNAARQNSLTDSLTGLSNRRSFDEALKTEFYRLKRSGTELSLIMLDVDYFKNFNDRYGHVAGDDCLRHMAEVFCRIVVRSSDIVARYGGEEFVFILPDTGIQGAGELAERIRRAVEALDIPHEVSDISKHVTVSLGVVTVSPKRLDSPDHILSLVDDAMYRAKNGGRNRVETAVPEVGAETASGIGQWQERR